MNGSREIRVKREMNGWNVKHVRREKHANRANHGSRGNRANRANHVMREKYGCRNRPDYGNSSDGPG